MTPTIKTAASNGIAKSRTFARYASAGFFLLTAEAVLHACPICFQTADAHLTSGVRAGVAVLIAVTVGVVGACVVFFGRVIKRQ